MSDERIKGFARRVVAGDMDALQGLFRHALRAGYLKAAGPTLLHLRRKSDGLFWAGGSRYPPWTDNRPQTYKAKSNARAAAHHAVRWLRKAPVLEIVEVLPFEIGVEEITGLDTHWYPGCNGPGEE